MLKILIMILFSFFGKESDGQFVQIRNNNQGPTSGWHSEFYVSNSPTNAIGNSKVVVHMFDSLSWRFMIPEFRIDYLGKGVALGGPNSILISDSLGKMQSLSKDSFSNLFSFATQSYITWANVSGKPSFATVATSGDYNDLSNQPTIPTNNNQLTNGSGYITASSTNTLTNKSGNISQWTNDASYLTTETDPTVGAWIKSITAVDISHWDAAYSFTNGFNSSTITTALGGTPVLTTRTISTTSPLSGGGDLSANRTLSIADAAADGSTKGVASFTAADFNSSSGNIAIDYTNGQAASTSTKGFLSAADWNTFDGKQNALVSGTNIKTINSVSLLGSGDISLDGSVLNEGSLTVNTGTGSTSIISSNTSGSTDVTLTAGTGIGISEAGNNITITSTVVAPGTDNVTAYSAGTAYTLTTSSAKVDFGTTDPAITINTAGTYLILTNLKIEYAGLTTALNACSFKLRRTNNTAADLTNALTTFNVPVLTLATGTGGDVDIAAIIYTTTNSNDVIELWGNRSGGLTVGSINVGEASIVAVRIY